MNIELTHDQKAFARRAVEAGRFEREEDAVTEALELWEERERSRLELIASLEAARASAAGGKGRIITEDSVRSLVAEVEQRGRARLLAKAADAV